MTIEGWIVASQASLITTITQRFTAISTLGLTFAETLRGPAEIFALVRVGATGGTIKLQTCSTNPGETQLIAAGATLELTSGVASA